MTFTLPLRPGILALLFCVGTACAAAADGGGKSEAPAKPAAQAAVDMIANCIGTNGDYATKGRRISFVITLENKCEKRLRCEVFAYVVGARGPASGHAILVLGPKSSGAAAKKSYAMRVKAADGTAQLSRDCKAF